MRLNNLVAKPFLLAAAFVLLAACHDDDKPEPEHEGEGQLIVTVENPGAQALALRIFGDGLTEPLESRFDAANATGKLDKWLPAGQYDALLTTDNPEAVTIDGTNGFATATATVRVPEGSTIMPALDTPVYVASRSSISLAEGKTNELTLKPEDIRKILRLTVTAPGRQISGSLNATLQGIAKAVNLATEEITSSATLGMLLPTPDAQKVCSTTAGILGVAWPEDVDPGTSSDTHLLTLSWQGTDGKKQTYSEDVSSQLYRATEADTDTLDLAITIPEEIAKVAIHLYTGIRTRATVDAFDGTPVNIAAGNTAGQYSDSWEGEATDNEIILSPERYYPADGSPVYLRGYYPAAPLNNGKVEYTLTGQEDLMLSVEQNGSIAEQFDAVKTPLTYRHLLSQLNFTLKLKGTTDSFRIRSVHINGLASTAIVDLGSEAIEPVGNAGPIVVYTDPGTGGFPITNGTVTLPGYVLVQPEATLTLDLVLNVDGNPANDKTFKDLPVKFGTGGSESGSAYEVEISLEVPDTPDIPDEPDNPDTPDEPDNPDIPDVPDTPDPEPENNIKVTVTVKVTDWNPGDQGGVTVDPYK